MFDTANGCLDLLNVPGVNAINVTRSQGTIKHYNVRIQVNNARIISELEEFWPFGVIVFEKERVYADFIVRPNELEVFELGLRRIPFYTCPGEVAILFAAHPVSDQLKKLIESSVRNADRLSWGDKMFTITLPNGNEQAVSAVKTRIEKILVSEQCTYNISVIHSTDKDRLLA